MKAFVPLNVAALRVSNADETNVTGKFKGATVAFDRLPYTGSQASTGDTIMRPLEIEPTAARLGEGVHLHWELPDHFKQGAQDPDTGAVEFPAVPNRWLVVRSMSIYDAAAQTHEPVQYKSWIVESDYVTANPTADADGVTRPTISVPLSDAGRPFMFMGRVVDAASWNPATENPADYLPHYTGPDGEALCLTSIGFVGPAFSGYYPDCRSVFGFWDAFADVPRVADAITTGTAIQFTASYQVVGWLADPADDPLATFGETVRSRYDTYVSQCVAERVAIKKTPADFFTTLADEEFGWEFQDDAVTFTLNNDDTLATLDSPDGTVVSGVVQEVGWNQLDPGADTPYLAAPGGGAVWTDDIDLAVGNTTVEAVSALEKSLLPVPTGSGVLSNYEFLLDALQLGLLRDIEGQGNALITLDETLHSRSFESRSGGHLWTVIQQASDSPPAQGQSTPPVEVTLPLELAEQLHVLNVAQQEYDRGRDRVDEVRKQLFMDWIILVKQFVSNESNPVVDTMALGNFVATSEGGELAAVKAEGAAVGLVHYVFDAETNQITGITTTSTGDCAATRLVQAHTAVEATLDALPHPSTWSLEATAAAAYWSPTDPVLIMEGDRIEPVRRNGLTSAIAARVDSELLSSLVIGAGAGSWTVTTGDLGALPTAPVSLPGHDSVQLALAEGALLMPLQAPAIGTTLAAQGGVDNPAAADRAKFVEALATAQGGRSPITGAAPSGLFAAVRAAAYQPVPNPTEQVTSPETISVKFTNTAATAWAPDAVGWSAQKVLPEFSATRYDPFLPVWLVWQVRLDPLTRGNGNAYQSTAITDRFQLDEDGVDYEYKLVGNAPIPGLTTGDKLEYSGSVVLSKRPTESLTQEIDRYISEFPNDAADDELSTALADYSTRHIMSQALSGFAQQQELRTPIPQIPVADLPNGDPWTTMIATAAAAEPDDTWYGTAFNSLAPISTGSFANFNFGPLRSGFLEVITLEIVDVFGQIMSLASPQTTSGAMRVVRSYDLEPRPDDTANAEKIYLPPRMLAASRLDFNWLSASHDDSVAGVDSDFVEMNAHPATSPVCGWVLPNHLDVNLMFYGADGAAIGSFGIEHDTLKYRTKAGSSGDLPDDIGPKGSPTVNPHLADVMWFIDGCDAAFLVDLMTAIQDSDQYINPANYAQDASLSVLIGRPLAIARMAAGLSTAGGVLPVSQANTATNSALEQAVTHGWTEYADRQAHSSAGLGGVEYPVRLGNLANIDDGLVAYMIDGGGTDPYSTVYSPAAPAAGANGVARPDPDTIELTLNGAAMTFTLFVDPRAPVHATTGVLPVASRLIPPDQYAAAMGGLAVTFTTHPVMRALNGLGLPLPEETGYGWSWVAPGAAPSALPAKTGSDVASYGYTPQRLLEGWLELSPTPDGNAEGN